MAFSGVIAVVLFFGISAISMVECGDSSSPLREDYYRRSCPLVEEIVKEVVSSAVQRDPGVLAGLIRMYFHDCFVRGCDASVLLDSPKGQTERDHRGNSGLQGFEVVDEIKARLEEACPMTVSCADILAFAARDSVSLSGGYNYDVPSGRRDGLVSNVSEVSLNLPSFHSDAQQLIDAFAKKDLTVDDMVALSGAHSIGSSHCAFFSYRLYSSNNTGPSTAGPSIEPTYAEYLKTKCPRTQGNGTVPEKVFLENGSPVLLDNRYYQDLMNRRGLLESDQTLQESPATAPIVAVFAGNNKLWAKKFAKAMVSLGNIEVLTGTQGEIRMKCSAVNSGLSFQLTRINLLN